MNEPEEPEDCLREYDYDACEDCIFRSYTLVPHAGGSSTATAENASCDLGHWEDDF